MKSIASSTVSGSSIDSLSAEQKSLVGPVDSIVGRHRLSSEDECLSYTRARIGKRHTAYHILVDFPPKLDRLHPLRIGTGYRRWPRMQVRRLPMQRDTPGGTLQVSIPRDWGQTQRPASLA